ncbi:MAG: patatin-like phospholipase family protein [Acidimicrobiales bacterium]
MTDVPSSVNRHHDGAPDMHGEPRGVAFALSGGANLGPVQAGTIAALVESGIHPDLLVGTSVGALNAAFLATRPGVTGTHQLVAAWSKLTRRDVLQLNPFRALAGFLGVRDHLISPLRLRSLIRRWIDLARIEDAPTRLAITATDALSGESVTLTEGDVVDALVASSAIPGMFPPVQIHGRWLVDGSLSANHPVRQAQDLGARDVYVVTTATAPRIRPPRGAVAVAMHSVSLVTTRIALQETEEAVRRAIAEGGRIFVAPSAEPVAPSTFDYRHGARLARLGYERARSWLEADPRPLVPQSPGERTSD